MSLVAGALFANAQDGMPVKGDWALTVNASPFLNYVGNLFSGFTGQNTFTGLSSVTTGPALANVVTGKYFTADNRAVRAGIGFNASTTSTTDIATPSTETKNSTNAFGINLGYEYRITKGKLVGMYGPQFGLGNSVTKTEKTGATNDKTQGGGTFMIGAGGFMGVEYFFTKNIAIGGEFGLNLNYSSTSKKENVNNGNTTPAVGEGSSFSFGTTNTSALSLSLYF